MTKGELFTLLEDKGLLDYGSVIRGDMIRKELEIELPTIGTKQDFSNAALAELKAVDYVRNILLGQGKYLASTSDSYRILLPSENAVQIEKYINSAMGKLKRSQKLSRNTPSGDHKRDYKQTARALVLMDSIKEKGRGSSL